MKLHFKIKQVKPRIFLFEFTDQYSMCMHFLRYQEFYESPNPKFRNKSFSILEYMEWQSKNQGNGNFTYPTIWGGFNIPSQVMSHCLRNIPDHNKYDDTMHHAYRECINKIRIDENISSYEFDGKFYIIGAMKDSATTIQHEVAHGFYYLNKDYKKEMDKLVKALPAKIRKDMETMFIKMGYTKQVFVDEIQAYFSTTENLAEYLDYYGGIKITGDKPLKQLIKSQKPFIELFKKYYE
jgi:hypothetical protein